MCELCTSSRYHHHVSCTDGVHVHNGTPVQVPYIEKITQYIVFHGASVTTLDCPCTMQVDNRKDGELNKNLSNHYVAMK